jgi:SnoaL-like domain
MKRRDMLQTMLLGSSVAAFSATAGEQNSEPTGNDTLVTEIEALLRQTEQAWDSQDTTRLKELWDTDDDHPYYLAGEQEDWFVGWEELNRYLDPPPGTPKVTQAIRVRFYNIRARLLAPDLAFAAYWMRTDMKLIFTPKPFGSDNRVSAVFRKKEDGWKYVCYAEAFQAPNLYFQKLFEKDVSPEYQEFFDQAMKKSG